MARGGVERGPRALIAEDTDPDRSARGQEVPLSGMTVAAAVAEKNRPRAKGAKVKTYESFHCLAFSASWWQRRQKPAGESR